MKEQGTARERLEALILDGLRDHGSDLLLPEDEFDCCAAETVDVLLDHFPLVMEAAREAGKATYSEYEYPGLAPFWQLSDPGPGKP